MAIPCLTTNGERVLKIAFHADTSLQIGIYHLMRWLALADAVFAILNDFDSLPARRVQRPALEAKCIFSIVPHELFYGAFQCQRLEHNIALVDALRFEALDFGVKDARAAEAVNADQTLRHRVQGVRHVERLRGSSNALIHVLPSLSHSHANCYSHV